MPQEIHDLWKVPGPSRDALLDMFMEVGLQKDPNRDSLNPLVLEGRLSMPCQEEPHQAEAQGAQEEAWMVHERRHALQAGMD